jgi:N-acetylglucosamine malate deacetylase 1
MKVNILAVGVHPDDVELSCSGVLLKHIAMGHTAGILDLTLGELGTRGTPELRTKEAHDSARILGVAFRTQLAFKDGFFQNDEVHTRMIIEQIRKCQPDIVLCNAISDRHPDHGRAARLTAEACFYSGLSKIKTVVDGQAQSAWRPKAVYHYIQDNYIEPDFVVDVTSYIGQKHSAIMAFASQFYDPNSKEPQTPISSKEFLDYVDSKMAMWGRSIGVAFAEGFTVTKIPGVNSLFDLK